MSFETILPFLQPIAHLVTDASISEIMVNGDQSVFIQRNGRIEPVTATVEQKYLVNAVKRIARSLGEDISEAKPLLDARLPDGSRVAAAFPPCSLYGVTLTIRKFRPNWFTLTELVTAGALGASVADQLAAAVRNRQTILVSGGTDTGKTTFTKALLDHIPQSERLAIIEDTMELRVDYPNAIRFEARRSQTDADGNITVPGVSIRDLVKATLRHRPDRLIIGEVRGAEAFDLLDALNTGHAGSIMMRPKFDQQWWVSSKSAPTEAEQSRVLELIWTAKVGSEVLLSGLRLLLSDLTNLEVGTFLSFLRHARSIWCAERGKRNTGVKW